MVDPAGAVRRPTALRHDALAAERAGVFEEERAGAVVVLIEGDGLIGLAQKLCQGGLAFLDRLTPQIAAVEFD